MFIRKTTNTITIIQPKKLVAFSAGCPHFGHLFAVLDMISLQAEQCIKCFSILSPASIFSFINPEWYAKSKPHFGHLFAVLDMISLQAGQCIKCFSILSPINVKCDNNHSCVLCHGFFFLHNKNYSTKKIGQLHKIQILFAQKKYKRSRVKPRSFLESA